MTHLTDAERAEPIKMQPGDDLHLTMLMASHGLNFVTGKDREQLLAWGRDVWQAARRAPAVPVPQVDAIGAALELESRAKLVESQTTERAMLHAANCLRLLAAAPQPPEATVNQQLTVGAAPVQMPEPGINTANHAGIRVIGYTEQQVRDLLAAAKVERKPLTDEQVFECTTGTLSEQGHHLIHTSDPDYAAMCGTEPGARWILSNVYPENSLAFARAIERAHGIGKDKA